MTVPIRRMNNDSPPSEIDFVAAQLSLLAIRTSELADLVTHGQISFLDAVDLSYDAAVSAGLVDAVGDDQIQKLLAACFGGMGAERSGAAMTNKEFKVASAAESQSEYEAALRKRHTKRTTDQGILAVVWSS